MPPKLSKFTNPVIDVVFSSFKMSEAVLDEQRVGIRWVSMANYDLATTVETIKEAIRDQRQAKNIVVQVLQKFLGDFNVQTLINHMYDIYELVKKQSQNKLAFGTAIFIPAEEKSWAMYGIFNKECQILNEMLNIPRVNLHRSVMSQISIDDLTLRVRPACWQEFQLGLAVGSTLSHEGQENLLRYIQTVFDKVFSRNAYVLRSRAAKVLIPPSLACTPGYYDNTYYVQVLEQMRIIRPRPRSTGGEAQPRLKYTDKRLPGWRFWKVYSQHGPLWSPSSREGILEAHLIMHNKSDPKPVWNQAVESVEVVNIDETDDESDFDQPNPPMPDRNRGEKQKNSEENRGEKQKNSEENDDDVDDSVFEQPNPPMPDRNRGEKQKNTKRKSIESENDDDRTTELLQLAKNKVQECERMLSVTNEKVKAFKKELSVKDAQIVREKAASKHWRAEAEKKQTECDEALSELYQTQLRLKRAVEKYGKVRN